MRGEGWCVHSNECICWMCMYRRVEGSLVQMRARVSGYQLVH